MFAKFVLVVLKRIIQKSVLESCDQATESKQSKRRETSGGYYKANFNEGNVAVHKEYRRRYTNPWKVETTVGKLDWKDDCLFCGEHCITVSSNKHHE